MEIPEGKGPLESSARTWEKTLTWRGRIGIVWLVIGIFIIIIIIIIIIIFIGMLHYIIRSNTTCYLH